MIEELFTFILDLFTNINYLLIFIGMFIESSFIPFPSEIVMIPAGVAASKNMINLHIAIFLGALASLCGAILNYILGYYLGRKFILKYNKYFFIKKDKLLKSEKFFDKYGNIATFLARLIPLVRQYISIICGLSKMNFYYFAIYTFLGAFIWCYILAILGFYIGDNEELIKKYLHLITIFIVIFAIIIISIFLIYKFIYKKNDK